MRRLDLIEMKGKPDFTIFLLWNGMDEEDWAGMS